MASQVGTVLAAVQVLVPGPDYAFGERFLKRHKPAPLVTWVPGTDRFDGPSVNPGRTHGGSVKTRRAAVDAFIVAASYDAACALLNAIVLALHDTAHGSVEISSAEWFNPSWLEFGDGCRLSFSLLVPVMRASPVTTQPTGTAFDTTGSVSGDGALDAGES